MSDVIVHVTVTIGSFRLSFGSGRRLSLKMIRPEKDARRARQKMRGGPLARAVGKT